MLYAYTTFMMRGDGYLPGALVLAYALKLQTNYDCICLVTDDVSPRARQALGLVYDKVIPIRERRVKSSVGTGRNDRNVLMTRFEALRLGPGGGLGQEYDKIILLDADVLPVWGYDDLFLLPAPAGIIMERKEECYAPFAGPGAFSSPSRWSWHSLYNPICPHGAGIPEDITNRVRRDPTNMGVNAGLWVLWPSLEEYDAVQTMLQTPEIMALVKAFPWPEMQLATLLWSGRWTNIDISYCSIGGYPRPDLLKGMHFAGLKPWQVNSRSAAHYAKFPDFTLWRQYFTGMYWAVPQLRDYPMLKRLWEFCKRV